MPGKAQADALRRTRSDTRAKRYIDPQNLTGVVEGVNALDANIGGYAHESGRSVIIVVNTWNRRIESDKVVGKIMKNQCQPMPADIQAYAGQILGYVTSFEYF